MPAHPGRQEMGQNQNARSWLATELHDMEFGWTVRLHVVRPHAVSCDVEVRVWFDAASPGGHQVMEMGRSAMSDEALSVSGAGKGEAPWQRASREESMGSKWSRPWS